MNNYERRFVYEEPNPAQTPALDHPAMRIAFLGNPNCGKTTLFNDYTGSKLKTANWPGVTVEGKIGQTTFEGIQIELVDLPGIYSLTCYTQEEEVARNYVLDEKPDVIIDVVDASSLERSLYLSLQLIALNVPIVVALNMMDIVRKRGMEIDIHRLSEMLGAPVIPVSARKREGLQPLLHACYHHKGHVHDPYQHFHSSEEGMEAKHQENVIVYSKELEDAIDAVQEAFSAAYPHIENPRWHAIKLLEHDAEITKRFPLNHMALSQSFEDAFITQRYDFIQEIVNECVFNKEKRIAATDKIDSVFTNRFAAISLFLLIMAAVFALTFVLGDAIKDLFEQLLSVANASAAAGLFQLGASSPVVSLICDGVINGVGTVLTFLPNIFFLFFALAFLEDSGYMSRVAYVMDGVMGKLGLSGRAFIPMILGFGCTVPAIMGTRALESHKDRLRTMLVTPFMSCSARLPIYVLFAGLFFPHMAAIVAFSMYVLGIVVALIVLKVLDVARPQHLGGSTLLIELPEYKMPSAHTIWIYVSSKVADYIMRAGTVIFVASVAIWLLLNFGLSGYCAQDVSLSFAAGLGHVVAPVLAPIGSGDWRLAVALLAGISAKEVVVSSVSVLFGASGSALSAALASIGFGPANALAFMTFCLLYVPCIATIATIAQEARSAKFALFCCVMQLVIAWVLSWIVFVLAQGCV